MKKDPKILFLTHPYPNYVPDLTLHGLRKLLGSNVIDYPRKDCLYEGVLGLGVCPENQLCPNWFPTDGFSIDREDIETKLNKGYFRYTIIDIRALSSQLLNILSNARTNLILIDGEDYPVKLPPGNYIIFRRETDGTDYSIPLPMSLPEEIMNWIISYDNLPKRYTIGFIGSVGNFNNERADIINYLNKLYPDSLLKIHEIPFENNQQPLNRVSRDDYYKYLQMCKITLTLKGAGNDTFRFWENSACNAVHISQELSLFIPNDFKNGRQILRFSSYGELVKLIDNIVEDKLNIREIIDECRNHLIKYHLTTKRAQYLLDRIINSFEFS